MNEQQQAQQQDRSNVGMSLGFTMAVVLVLSVAAERCGQRRSCASMCEAVGAAGYEVGMFDCRCYGVEP